MERRSNERYSVWFPMTVVTDEGEEGTAITYDVSATGLLMACPGSLDVGAHVTLQFHVTDASETRTVGAKIVRNEPNEEGDAGPWRYRMAVEFDQAQADLEGLVEAEAQS